MRPLPQRSSLLVVVALVTLPVACGPGYGSLGDHASDTGTTAHPCGVVQLADIAAGIGGFALDGVAAEDRSGSSVSGAGDVNGDGLADVIVVGPAGTGPAGETLGHSYVVFGKPDTDRVLLSDIGQGVGGFALDGEAAGDGSGVSVSGAGDVNRDGLADVVVGANRAASNGLQFSGRTYVVFGTTDTAPVLLADVAQGIGGFALAGEAADDLSGFSVSGAGDVNGDGIPDIVVGADHAAANGVQDSGRTYVVFGKADTAPVLLADVAQGLGGFALDGEAERDTSGKSVSGAGDINGDGLADVVVGAPSAHANGLQFSGRTYVVFGKADTAPGQLADVTQGIGGFALDGEAESATSGWSVSGAGDVNGDGLADVVVGTWEADPTGNNSSRTYVVFGKADTDRVQLADVAQGIGGFVLEGESQRHSSDHPVSGAGDINGDGLADVIVGAPRAAAIDDSSGRTYVVFGKADTARVLLADVAHGIGGFALDGEAAGDQSGFSLSGAGDINGDSIPDIVVGAPHASPTGNNSGRTYVIFGGDFSCGGR